MTLASADPRVQAKINFNYPADPDHPDHDAMVLPTQFVRRIMEGMGTETLPGPKVKTPADIRLFARNNAWGHHAGGTSKMGPKSDPTAVVNSKFGVHGLKNVWVVDGSIWPEEPAGPFPWVPTALLGFKAAGDIHAASTAVH